MREGLRGLLVGVARPDGRSCCKKRSSLASRLGDEDRTKGERHHLLVVGGAGAICRFISLERDKTRLDGCIQCPDSLVIYPQRAGRKEGCGGVGCVNFKGRRSFALVGEKSVL